MARRAERVGERTVAAVLASGLGIISVVLFAAGHVGSARWLRESPSGVGTEIYLRETWFTLLLAVLALFTAIYFAISALNSRDEDFTYAPIAKEPK